MIENWNIDLVEDMSYMFANAQVFNQDLSIWNPVEVTTMSSIWLIDFNAGRILR